MFYLLKRKTRGSKQLQQQRGRSGLRHALLFLQNVSFEKPYNNFRALSTVNFIGNEVGSGINCHESPFLVVK